MPRSVLLACILTMSLAGLAAAEPLHPGQVSAEAKWLVHFDADAFRLSDARRMSAFMDKSCQQWEEKCKAFFGRSEELRKACRIFDVTTDLKGLTFYGMQFQRPEGVALVHGKFSEAVLTALVEQVRRWPDYATSKHQSRQLRTWMCGKGTERAISITAVQARPDLLVLATSVSAAGNALDVLDGAKPSIVGESILDAPTPAGELFVARATGLAEANLPGDSPLVKLALTASTLAVDSQFSKDSPVIKDTAMLGVTIGEVVTEVFFTSQIVVQEGKNAESVKKAIDSHLDSALYLVNDADLADLVYHVTVEPQGKSFLLDVRGPADVGWNYVDKFVKKLLSQEKDRNEITPRK